MSDGVIKPRIRAYQAPENPPVGYVCRRLFIPDDEGIIAAVNDVLAYLTYQFAWVDGTNVSQIDMEEIMSEMLLQFGKGCPMTIGSIVPIATAGVGAGLLLCDGSQYAKSDYPALFNVLDAQYIVDPVTFVVPDLRSRWIVGAGQGAGLSDYPLGVTGGSETVTLDTTQIPAHTHTTQPHHHSYDPVIVGDLDIEGVGVPQPNAAQIVPLITENTYDETVIVDNAGGGTAHENRPPFVALRYAIIAG